MPFLANTNNPKRPNVANNVIINAESIPKVFKKTHELISRLVSENKIPGVLIDHIDGLYNPGEYPSTVCLTTMESGSSLIIFSDILKGLPFRYTV